ncbi:Phosphatidylinositol 4-kinase LSB6 [Tilletia horrida]|uniref:Phosphatidylinositol 4-kinase n=1 Tax=Tilletia horrida TaxID=155126 RepID=A0AAN6GNV0_9BASI|nr:Phosphatidylinositol 4-kinase LSB6 [Tilletia horrida]KAK0565003.1 Phosphatidylinositol 4-kinase LSB6 [Tilletia horrida]
MDESAPLLGTSASHSEISPAVAQNGSHSRSGGIADLDDRLQRWKAAMAARFSSKGKAKQQDPSRPSGPVALISVFHRIEGSGPGYEADPHTLDPASDADQDVDERVEEVKAAIEQGVLPKMIQTGSSGSYFARRINPQTSQPETIAVFKPRDEEPYGDLNPKRVLLRKYFWWMMGRPCLVPNFSASSEAGASYLDGRLNLHIVPPTHLVSLSAPSFFYAHSDREAWKKHKRRPPEKIGSFQLFLNGYENASDFLRKHPWPTRPLHLLEADLAEERAAHRLSRKKQKAYLRRCLIAVKRFLLCRTAPLPSDGFENDVEAAPSDPDAALAQPQASVSGQSFQWTPDTMRSFRIELEKLVVLDYLMRNTDRGLDNFMIRTSKARSTSTSGSLSPGSTIVQIGAIDNSLSFPHRHPNGLRDYPFGWLWLPADVIGQPFSQETRNHFLPLLSDASWWIETVAGLRKIFERDEQFSAKVFDRQMQVMRGQGLTLVDCLMQPREGPIELCARPRQIVPEKIVKMTYEELQELVQQASSGTVVMQQGAKENSVVIKELPPHHRELDKVVERPQSEALTDSNEGVPPALGSAQNIDSSGTGAHDAIEIPSARVPIGVTSETEPRSLPLAESGASLAALLRWQEVQQTQQETSSQRRGDLKRSMTGIEVLEWEISSSHTSRGPAEILPIFGRRASQDRQALTRSPPPPRLMRSPATSPTISRGRMSMSVDQLPETSAAAEPEGDGVIGRVKPSFFRMRSSTGSFFRPTQRGRPGRHMARSPGAGGDVAVTGTNEADEAGSDLDVSVMSLPAGPHRGPIQQEGTSSHARGISGEVLQQGQGQEHAADGRAGLGGRTLRKRMGSVSGWSVTSLGSAFSAEGTRRSNDEVKVIVQRAVHDPSRPFLSWY